MISGATVLAQGIGLVASPVMTRLYSPEEYGAFFIVNSIGLALSAGLALRLEQAVPLPKDEDEVRNLVVVALGATAGLSLLTLLASVVWGGSVENLVGMPGQSGGLLLVAPMAASFALFAVLNAVAIREGRFVAIARRHLVLASLTVALQVGAGVFGAGLMGLCLATVVAQVGAALSMVIGSPFMAKGLRRSRRSIRRTLGRFRHFPLVLAPAGWLNSLGANAPLVAVGAIFSSEVAGWFGLTLRVVAVPATFVGSAIANVYVSELARRHREGAATQMHLFYRVSKNLFWAGLAFGSVLALVAPSVFTFVFGPEWAPTGDMTRAYAIAAVAQMVASPVSGTLTVHEHVYQQIAWDASRLSATVGSVWLAWAAGASPLEAIWVLSGATALLYAINWEMCRRSVLHSQS